MDAPAVRYATTQDGYSLAFFDTGAGLPVVFVPSRMSHLGRTWDRFGAWVRPLAGRYRLIHYDARGQGLSSRGLKPDTSVQDFVNDLQRILDHLHIERAVLLAHGFGGHVVLRFAEAFPARVEALLLVSVTVEMKGWLQPLWQGVAEDNWDFFVRSLVPNYVPPEQQASYIAGLKDCETLEDYVITTKAVFSSSVKDALGRLSAPVLVMHPRNFSMLSPQEGPKLAAAIPGSRLAMLGGNGDDFLGDPDDFTKAIESFLATLPDRESAELKEGPYVTAVLSSRERDVLRLLASGKSNREIAQQLCISWHTAAKHVSSILNKTGFANRAEAAAYAARHRLT